MSIRFRRFEPGDEAAIARLNQRLRAGGASDVVFPEAPDQPSESRGDPISQECYVAVDGDEIRGGVWLHEHDFRLGGRAVRAGWLKYPVAESLVDRNFGGVPAGLIVTLMRRQPLLMALGMGGGSNPLAQLLRGFGWTLQDVPFRFAVLRPHRVARELPQLRRTRARALLADVAAFTGIASIGAAPLVLRHRAAVSSALAGLVLLEQPSFERWADPIWQAHRDRYGFVARRDGALLDHMYSPDFPGLVRVRVREEGRDVGWVAVTMSSDERAHTGFGRLRVGMIADAFGAPEDAPRLLAAGARELARRRADILVSNQLHPVWDGALKRLGFLAGPSNFLFACSKPMRKLIDEAGVADDHLLNRGDCDGPPRW